MQDHFLTSLEFGPEVGQNIILKPNLQDPIHQVSAISDLQPPQTAPPAGDQVFKHMSPYRTYPILTIIREIDEYPPKRIAPPGKEL